MRPFLLAFLLAACGAEAPAPSDVGADWPEEPPVPGRRDWDPSAGTIALRGVVRFEGEPPARKPVDMGGDPACCSRHEKPVLSETYVVGPEGGFANVFVQVTGGLEGWRFPRAEGDALLDQRGCVYVPHVLSLEVGQTLRVRNSDPILHNVHGYTLKGDREFCNWGQAAQGREDSRQMRKPGILAMKCDVHGWMQAYVCVAPHPFHAVTGEDGAFTLPPLPPGTYVVEAWHEKLGTRTAEVVLAEGAPAEVSFAFSR